MDTLSAVKLAYRKHVLNDDSIGWDELGNCLLDAICNEIGDSGYNEWLSSITSVQADSGKLCGFCGEPVKPGALVCKCCFQELPRTA